MMSSDPVFDLVRKVGIFEVKEWISGIYDEYKLEGRGELRISKSSLWALGAQALSEFISQFPEIKELFETFFNGNPEKKPPKLPKVKQIKKNASRKSKKKEKENVEEPVFDLTTDNEDAESELSASLFKEKKTPKLSKKKLAALRPKFKSKQLSEEEMVRTAKCLNFAVLENFINSCYMDSVLMILFSVLKEFTTKYIIGKEEFTNEGVCDKNDPEKDKDIRRSIQTAIDALLVQLTVLNESDECQSFRNI
jgi:hypothetical protein